MNPKAKPSAENDAPAARTIPRLRHFETFSNEPIVTDSDVLLVISVRDAAVKKFNEFFYIMQDAVTALEFTQSVSTADMQNALLGWHHDLVEMTQVIEDLDDRLAVLYELGFDQDEEG